MLKAFKYRIYPSEKQCQLIEKHIGSCRFVYNLALEVRSNAYNTAGIKLSCFDLIKQLPGLKEECPWLKEVSGHTLQQSIRHLENAYSSFFAGRTKFPTYKKKSGKKSFTTMEDVRLKDNKLYIAKFREGIVINLHRPVQGSVKQAVVSRTNTGKYFVSILCDTQTIATVKQDISENNTIGIDLGIKTFIVASNDKEYQNPKFLKQSLSKLKFLQRKYSKHKGKRTKQRLVLTHEKVANQRKDFLHKVSTELIRENQSIAIENLQVFNMLKNHNLAQSISDVGWSMFVDFLKYKAEWYGVNILQIGTFEPSSKLHNGCGYLNKELKLSDREWLCPACNTMVQRDLNAAMNIKSFALRNHVSGTETETRDELPTMVGVMTPEAQVIG